MSVHLTPGRPGHLAADAYQQLRSAILDGRLREGTRLPPSRELARTLALSRNTVLRAYDQLTAEGFIEGRRGSGTLVRRGVAVTSSRSAPAGALKPRAAWSAPEEAARERRAVRFDFQVGAPDPSLFPWEEWRRLVGRQLRGRGQQPGYAAPEGEPPLRAAIARHLGVSRSVRAGPEDVLVTAGAQQALDLIGRVLLEPGDVVAVEQPGYPQAARLFRSLGATVVGVPVDGEGLVVPALPARCRLVYVTPSHQFPLGVAMSLSRRQALLAWAERRGAALIEDDYDSEFRFDGRSLEPLQALDGRGRVLYVGSFSKVLLPGLRLGFVVAPRSLLPALRSARGLTDSHSPPELQRALAAFIDQGSLARHTRRLRRVYGARREVLHEALRRELGAKVRVWPSVAGLHLGLTFRDVRVRAATVTRRALERGVAVEPVRAPGRDGLALGYGVIPVERIAEGVRLLAACVGR